MLSKDVIDNLKRNVDLFDVVIAFCLLFVWYLVLSYKAVTL